MGESGDLRFNWAKTIVAYNKVCMAVGIIGKLKNNFPITISGL